MASIPTSCISSNKVLNKYVSPSQKVKGPTKKANIPVIDLQDETNATSQIMKACKTMGLFMVINHGIPIEKMNKTMKNIEAFHNLPIEEKKKYPFESDTNRVCAFNTSEMVPFITCHNDEEMLKNKMLRDGLHIQWPRSDESIKFWPDNPKNFNEDMGEHALAVKDISSRILEHLSEGLGLERGYLGGELAADFSLNMYHYPPSPNPKMAQGVNKHMDWNIITLLQTGHVPGLQLFQDDQWFDVESPPTAFVVLMGSHIEVISNGNLKGVPHRVIITSSENRYSAVYSRHPTPNCVVEPAKDILKAQNCPPLYRSFRLKDINKERMGLRYRDDDYDVCTRELLLIK